MRKLQLILGAILIILGTLALAYGGFSYTEESHDADLGPVELRLEEKEHVNIPTWAGAASILLGAGLLFAGRRPRR